MKCKAQRNIGTESFFGVQQPRRNPVKHFSIFSVSKEGLEPSRACAHSALNAACLPIPPFRLNVPFFYFPTRLV